MLSKKLINLELFKNGPIIIFIWENSENWPVKNVSENIEDIFGYESSDFVSQKLVYKDLIHIDDIDRVIIEVKNAIENNLKSFIHEPYRIKDKNGDYKWVKDITNIIIEDNEIKYFVGYIMDITNEINLKIENERAKLVFHAFNDTLWDWDVITNQVYFSPQWKKMIGYEDHEIGSSVEEWEKKVHPDDLNKANEDIENYFNGKSLIYKNEHRILCKDNSYKWILDRGVIIERTLDNKPKRVIGTHSDISKRKKLEEEILKEKNFISTIIESANCVISVIDSSGTMIKLNNYGQEFTGYTQEEISSKPYFWEALLPEEIKDSAISVFEEAKKGNLTNSFRGYWISKLGKKKFFEWSNTIVNKEDGSFDYIVTIGIDITQSEKQKIRLKQQKEEFETIFNNAKDGIAIVDLNTNFLEFNDAYLRLTQYTREELLTKSTIELSISDQKDQSIAIINDVVKYGTKRNYLRSFMTKKGNIVTLNISSTLLPDKKRILITAKDITKDKVYEEQSKLASMGEMIGNIAHQWRQPLSVVSAVASNVRLFEEFEPMGKDEIIKNMKVIDDQIQYLSKTIDDFRNFIKNNNQKELFSLKDTISNTLTILNPTFINNSINMVSDLQDDIMINGYKNELIQSFINILNNSKDALKQYIPTNFGRYIFINTKKTNNSLIMEIKDNGLGIKESIIDKIFEPYFTTKHQSVGTGIGLSMTYRIITEHHDAKIEVFNTEYRFNEKNYKGLCFRIIFKYS